MTGSKAVRGIIWRYLRGAAYLLLCGFSVLMAFWVHDGFFTMLSFFACITAVICIIQLAAARLIIRPQSVDGVFSASRGERFALPFKVSQRAWKVLSPVAVQYTFALNGTKRHRMFCRYEADKAPSVYAGFVGYYDAYVNAVFVSDMLGLFVRRIRIRNQPEQHGNLVVLPRGRAMHADYLRYYNPGRADSAAGEQDGIDCPREYMTGDELRRVDWKTTARKRSMYVKGREGPELSMPAIAVMPPPHESIEQRSIAAELLYSLSRYIFEYIADGVRIYYPYEARTFAAREEHELRLFTSGLNCGDGDCSGLYRRDGNVMALIIPSDCNAEDAQGLTETLHPSAVYIYGESGNLKETLFYENAVKIGNLEQWESMNADK